MGTIRPHRDEWLCSPSTQTDDHRSDMRTCVPSAGFVETPVRAGFSFVSAWKRNFFTNAPTVRPTSSSPRCLPGHTLGPCPKPHRSPPLHAIGGTPSLLRFVQPNAVSREQMELVIGVRIAFKPSSPAGFD